MTTTPQIHGLMAAILADLPSVPKGDWNDAQKFKFRSIDAVMDVLNPVLAKHGVYLTPDVEERISEVRQSRQGTSMWTVHLKVRYRFYAPDGSSVDAVGWGEGMDLGDKATSKAMTMALKYVLFQVFCIATDEVDPDAESEPAQPPPATDTVARKPGHALADAAAKAGFGIPKGADEDTKAKKDMARRDVLQAATGKRSSKDFTPTDYKTAIDAFVGLAEGTLSYGEDEDGVPTLIPVNP